MFKREVVAGRLVIEPFPVPMTTRMNEFNIASEAVIAYVNDQFTLNETHDLITDYTTDFSPSLRKSIITQFVADSTTLGTYDKSSYAAYNENS
jgi:hypothetical protein